MEMARRRRRDGDGVTKTVQRRWCDEDGASATKIAATEAMTLLNSGAKSIGTLNLGFRVKGKNSLSFMIWEGIREFTQRRMCCNLRRS